MRLRARKGSTAEAVTELERLVTDNDTVDAGQLVRALSRAVVHVPLPGAAAQHEPRVVRGPDGPPLYVLEDDEGRHALAYTSAAALVRAWGDGVTAATVPMASLLAAWQPGVDLVLNAGLPTARVVPESLLEQAAYDAVGVPTAVALRPSPAGTDLSLPNPEPVQVIGATRDAAAHFPEVRAMWRASALDREPAARPVLTLVVEFGDTSPERVAEAMSALAEAIAAVDPLPVRLLAATPGGAGGHAALADEVKALDAPYWTRD